MKFSIVTVCFNAEKTIESCLQSVARQVHVDIEHIIIDGMSSDNTVEIVKRYPHVAILVSERDNGIYDAMNKGLARAAGDYVLFLNADDELYSPSSLTNAQRAIEENPGADVYYGSLEVRPIFGSKYIFTPPPPDQAPEFLITGCLPHQSTLASPSVFEETGAFNTKYPVKAEYDWFLKLFAYSIDVRQIDCTIGSFKEGGASYRLDVGEPELYAIQRASQLYNSREWDRKRIAAFQQALLAQRIENMQLVRTAQQSQRQREDRAASLRRSRSRQLLLQFPPPVRKLLLRTLNVMGGGGTL